MTKQTNQTTFDAAVLVSTVAALVAADKAYDNAVPSAASAVAKLLGTSPSFDLWESVAAEFQAQYSAQRGCEAKTAANRWSAVTTYMAQNYALEKPAKPTEQGKKKAAQRAKHEKAVKAARAQCVKPAEAFSKAAELVAAGKVAEAKVYTEAGHALAKEAQAKADKAASGELKKVRDAVRAEVSKCHDIAALKAALDWLKSGKELKTEAKKALARAANQANRVRKAPAPAAVH